MAFAFRTFPVAIGKSGRIKTDRSKRREEQLSLSRLLPECLTRSDSSEIPEWRVAGASPALEASAAALVEDLPEISAMLIASPSASVPTTYCSSSANVMVAANTINSEPDLRTDPNPSHSRILANWASFHLPYRAR